jgi:hypothetical protein
LLAFEAGEVALILANGDADGAFDTGGELGEEVVAFGCGGEGAAFERGHLGVVQVVELGGDAGEVLLGLLDGGEGLGEGFGGGECGGVVVVGVDHAVEEGGVGAEEGVVGEGHEAGAAGFVGGGAGEVGVDAAG